MKKGLLVLLIAVIPTMMPNLVSAVAIDVSDAGSGFHIHGLDGLLNDLSAELIGGLHRLVLLMIGS